MQAAIQDAKLSLQAIGVDHWRTIRPIEEKSMIAPYTLEVLW